MGNSSIKDRIINLLTALYGEKQGLETWSTLQESMESFQKKNPQLNGITPLDTLENLDALLITYADQIQSPGQPHLQTLADFLQDYLNELTSAVHLLPFFPYSSDDGFSVIDYKAVNPAVGDWEDLDPLRNFCKLMFDAVINHISSQSSWFQKYLRGEDPYTEYFLTVDLEEDLSQVVRPRAKPLLSEVETTSGFRYVWTTFSTDQIDLNYKNPAVLLEIIDILLFYIHQGALIIRLDAIAYLWKEIGTSCIHLPQTHQVIKLMRAVLDYVAPGVLLITETNVPHQENISYFGNQLSNSGGKYPLGDEAQMVYQFPLAPLVLHTFRTENAQVLNNWASSIETPFSSAAFLNFIASHDGIGVRPAEGLLSTEEIQGLVNQVIDHGGEVSYKTNPDGSKSVYELNITLYDALSHPQNDPLDLGVKRFMASQAIMLSLSGVPGIYIHSLFGSPNSHESVKKTGRVRSINREKFQYNALKNALKDNSSRASRVFSAYTHYLKIRKEHPAFKPLAPQLIPDLGNCVFAVLRTAADESEKVLCLINVISKPVEISLDGESFNSTSGWIDLLTGDEYSPGKMNLGAYQVLWLKEK
jgi:sucrose phosphorylase